MGSTLSQVSGAPESPPTESPSTEMPQVIANPPSMTDVDRFRSTLEEPDQDSSGGTDETKKPTSDEQKYSDKVDRRRSRDDEQKERGKKDDDDRDKRAEDDQSANPPTPGDLLLRNMTQMPGNSAAVGAASAPASSVDDIANEVASRVLVAGKDLNASSEVRLQVRQDLLPDTEIRIARDGGQLTVDITTSNDQSFSRLADQQSALTSHLNAKLPDKVVVNVSRSDAGGMTGGGSQDGRSRQQRFVVDEREAD